VRRPPARRFARRSLSAAAPHRPHLFYHAPTPPRAPPSRLRALPPTPASNYTFLQSPQVAKTIRQLINNGSAPGPSGWTGDHLLILSSDPTCLRGITLIAQYIINNQLSAAARSRILACTLLTISKDDTIVNGAEAPAPRPIAISEIFYRLAAQLALRPVLRAHHHTLFPSVQLGIGHSGGLDAAIHTTRLALASSPLHCTLQIAFQNAFNSRHRSVIAQSLYSQPVTAPLWQFQFAYGSASPLLYYAPDATSLHA
jgi:hypothetical protein